MINSNNKSYIAHNADNSPRLMRLVVPLITQWAKDHKYKGDVIDIKIHCELVNNEYAKYHCLSKLEFLANKEWHMIELKPDTSQTETIFKYVYIKKGFSLNTPHLINKLFYPKFNLEWCGSNGIENYYWYSIKWVDPNKSWLRKIYNYFNALFSTH